MQVYKAKEATAIVAMIDALTVNDTASGRYHLDLELRKILDGRASDRRRQCNVDRAATPMSTGRKAALTRKRRAAGRKAAATRKRNRA